MSQTNDNNITDTIVLAIPDDIPDAVDIIKRGRGRPKKIVEEKKPMKRGRPIINPLCTSKDKEYYAQYYRDHFQGVKVVCPVCSNPDIKKQRLLAHVRTNKCFRDELFKKKYPQDAN